MDLASSEGAASSLGLEIGVATTRRVDPSSDRMARDGVKRMVNLGWDYSGLVSLNRHWQ